MEKYDRTMLSDEDDSDEDRQTGSISANVVASVHFGGGTPASGENAVIKRLLQFEYLANLEI